MGAITSSAIYEYTYSNAGAGNIETMKAYALSGSGLCSFIKRYVNKKLLAEKYDNSKFINRKHKMDIIITYDIKRNHTEIKNELKSLGYQDTIVGVSRNTTMAVTQQLPNTTLLKYGAADAYSVMEQVVSVINKHNGGLDRIFCAQLAVGFNWSGQ